MHIRLLLVIGKALGETTSHQIVHLQFVARERLVILNHDALRGQLNATVISAVDSEQQEI